MKLLIITLTLSVIVFNCAYSQILDEKSDCVVYESLFRELKMDKKDFSIYYKTSLQLLLKVNFKQIELVGVGSWMRKDTIKGMKSFFDKIEIGKLNDYQIRYKIPAHAIVNNLAPAINNSRQLVLTISPVVYSNNKRFAICSISARGEGDSVYLLANLNDSWQIVNFLNLGSP
jgi:hypothetical protein